MTSESLAAEALRILGEKSEKAHEIVKQTIREEKTGIKKIDDAVERYLSRWDDATRPGIISLACEAVGGNSQEAIPLQVSLHFIDAAMDIHDDIIDESASKSNIKTIYGTLGKDITLLLGDVFIVKGFSYMQSALEKFDDARKSLIMESVKNFLDEVVQAHIYEVSLKNDKWNVKPETYLQILTKKAADIEGRLRVGAICGGGSVKEIGALSRYGRNIGVLLLIRAEFVDLFEPDELSNRTKYECLPLHVLYSLQNKRYRNKIREILNGDIDKNASDALLQIIYKTPEVETLNQYLQKLKNDSVKALDELTESHAKNTLRFIGNSILEDL